MIDNMTPTKEQKKEFTVKALGIAGFTEKENYQWLYTQEHGMKTVVVNLNEWPVKPYFNVSGKKITEDDEHATLKKVRTIIKEAEDGQMPSRTEADIVVNVGTKDTSADDIDAPEHKKYAQVETPDQPDDAPTQTHKTMTHEEAMALPKQQFIDRCKAWLDEFNDGNQLNIDNPVKCPIHIWVVYNHKACGKDLVPNITNCEICGQPMCPDCSNHGVTQLSRVTGYMGDVAGWNAGKKQELEERQHYNLMD